jgi:hypothetical protein
MLRSSIARHALVSCFVGLTVAAFAACSSSSDGGSSGTTADASTSTDSSAPVDGATTDSATPTDSGTDTSMIACTPAADAGAACNTVVQTGTDAVLMTVAGVIPVGTGGAIADGRYHTTAVTAYAGSPAAGITLKQTWEFCQGLAVFVGDEPGKPQYRKNVRFTASGIQITSMNECTTQSPNVEVPFDSYTATPTTLTFYVSTLLFSVTLTKE